jgi:hypothetical protein
MSVDQRIAFFEFIKNIPYHIGLDKDDPNYNCVTKCDMLAHLLHGLGLKTRPIICTFDWTETPLPNTILALPRDTGETHQFLQVFIPETKTWINCDPTWDNGIRKSKFPIAQWDGLNETALAVKPHHIYTEAESLAIIKNEDDPVAFARHMKKHRAFYKAVNAWLNSYRL